MASRHRQSGAGTWAVSAALVAVAGGWTQLPGDKEYLKDLGGKWHFKLEQKNEEKSGLWGGGPKKFEPPAKLEAFEKEDYKEGPDWKEIKVPGNWEMQGWSVATYNQPDNVIGLYRLELDVPKGWEGRVVKINFDGVQNGAEVYLNAQPVEVDESSEGRKNYHQGGHTAFQADLTPAVRFGKKNVLAVRVYKNGNGVDLDSGDYFFLGGIHRKVMMFSVPQTRIEDLAIKTKVSGGGKGQVTIVPTLVGDARNDATVEARIDGLDLKPASAKAGQAITFDVQNAEYWSAEKPKLYDLRVDLKDGRGKVVESIKKRIGIREVSVEGGVFMVNHVPVKLAGFCRHDNDPENGTYNDEAFWRKDIEMMKANNVNSIRTSHYPYGSGFYDLCDEMGMYVMDEMSACWVPADTDRLTPFFAQHARELVRRDKNHASVIVWAIGNENKPGKNLKVAADEINKLDDTRPRLVSQLDANRSAQSEPGESIVELDDRHYTAPDAIRKANDDPRRKQFPMMYLENPNDWEYRNGADAGCLDLWGAVIQRTWDAVLASEHVSGTFLWEWADRAVADPYPTKLYDYFPKTGINLVKVKGQVDAYRNPRPGLYHVKMAYAPVKLDPKARVEGDEVVVHAKNWYSFTDLSELKTSWRLVRGGEKLDSGKQKVSLAPRADGELRFKVSKKDLSKADELRVEFVDRDGVHVATYGLKLGESRAKSPTIAAGRVDGVKFPRLNLVANTQGPSPKTGWHMVTRHRGSLRHIKVNGKVVADEKALYAMALGDVKDMEAELFVDDLEGVAGRVHAGVEGGKFSYRVEWTTDKSPEGAEQARRGSARRPGSGQTDIQELGWIFAAPKDADRFSWSRQAMWSWYPEDHIGRPRGTAKPDTMDQDITKLTRPDAFDFNSTKYDCDWVTLADKRGNGLGVRFDPAQRHHVRAGGQEGAYELVVNRYCCPPRDISSSVVPDFYLNIEKGKTIEGAFDVGSVTE